MAFNMAFWLTCAFLFLHFYGTEQSPLTRKVRQVNEEEVEDVEGRSGWRRERQRPGQGGWQGNNQGGWQGNNQGGWRPGNNQGGNSNQQGGNRPGNQNGNNQQQQRPTTTPAPNASTAAPTASPGCLARCPVTPEYNPVCGSGRQGFTNRSRLECAIQCGANVQFVRMGNC